MYTTNQSALKLRTIVLLGFALVSVSACSVGSSTVDTPKNGNIHEAIENATGPLQDLNLRRQEIPPLLQQALANPYAHKPDATCADIKTEVSQLDDLLGPDVAPSDIALASADGDLRQNIAAIPDMEIPDATTVKDTAVEEGGNFIHDTVMETIKNHVNVLPFRSIVRKLSGAERHQKRQEAAYQAGKLRRAYLKGFADMRFGEKCLAKPVVVEAKAGS